MGNSAYPAGNRVYVPSPETTPAPLTIEHVREHGVVLMSDGATGLVRVDQGLVVSFCRVTLNADGTVADFASCTVNKYVAIRKEKT